MSKPSSVLGDENYEKYRKFVIEKESSGNYQEPPNRFGFVGGYQMGAAALEDAGYIKKGASARYGNRALLDDANWTTPGGLNGFLNNPRAQDQAFDKYTANNYRALISNGVIKPNDPPDVVAGNLAAAHLIGAGDLKNKGLGGADGNGVTAASRFKGAAAAINGAATDPPAGSKGAANAKRSTTPEPRRIYNGSDRKLSESRIPNTVTIGEASQVDEIPVPFPNPLSVYSSFNPIITLSCLTKEAIRDPKSSYKAGDLGEIVLRNSGAGSFAQDTLMTTRDNPSGRYDFYIDNLDIDSVMSFNRQTKGSNATSISFEVIEPYSMGVFLQACEVAATKQKWEQGYLNAVFLLTIEFIGFNSDGEPEIVPNTARHIPMTFKEIGMSVKSNGSRYSAKGQPFNEMVFDNNHRLFEVDIAVSGKTVQEILQSGEFSLQTVINKRLQEIASKEGVPTEFDEIVIVFPKPDEINSMTEINDSNSSATNQNNSSVITVSRSDSSSTLIQDTETLNVIGLSKMDFDSTTGGESQVNKQDDVQEDPAKPVNRSKVVYDSKTRQFIYSQGTSIVSAISSILIHSEYCKTSSSSAKTDKLGMKEWFRIETQVDFQTPKEGNLGGNSPPKLLIFKIVPYKVHSERDSAPSAPVKGYDQLRNEAAKVYDYIYTGNNTEILNFEIEMKHAFFNTIAADHNKLNKQVVTNPQQSSTTEGDTAPVTPDNRPIVRNDLTGNMRTGRNLSITPDSGGTISEDQKTLIAKAFQKALYESETDLITASLTVAGDPYYLADSGMGNFSNTGSGRFNVTDTYAMDYQSGEVDIIINFRTPLDYDQDTGIATFGNSEVVEQFSGLYKINKVNHRIQKGKFTQELTLQRRKREFAKPIEAEYANVGSEALVDETGQVSSIRRNTETGELYDGTGLYDSGGRAIANPKDTRQVNKTTTVSANSNTPAMTDADKAQQFTDWNIP